MASRGPPRKRKAADKVPADDDESLSPQEAPHQSTRSSTRDRVASKKQEALNHSQNEQLQAKIKKLERENAKLRKHTSGKATSAKRRPESGNEDDDDDRLSVESEEESDTLVESRSMKSKFESRGIYTTEAPQAKKLRRLDDPAARKSPLAGASSADKDLRSHTTTGRSSTPPIPSSERPHATSRRCSRSESPLLSEPDLDISAASGHSPPPSRTTTPPMADMQSFSSGDCSPHHQDTQVQPSSARHQRTSASTPPESTRRAPSNSRTSPSPTPRSRTAPPPTDSRQSTGSASRQSTGGRSSRKSTGSSSQSARQADLQSPVATEELPFRGGIQPGASDAKASDYEPHATRLILAACRHFEALVLTNDPFPDEGKQELWVKDAWACTSDAVKRYYRLSDRVKKLIMSRTSHARGALKDCIRPLVTPKYGFSSSMDEATKITNRTLYERLLDLNNPEGPEPIFHYQNVDAVTGFARNEIVSHAIREQWFRNSDGIGLRLPTQFSPIREETLGIIFTAIEFCLDQWADGTLSEGARFTEKVYKPKYENHLRLIKEWTKIDPTVTEKIRKQMYDEARLASGAGPARATASGLSATSRSRLQAELDELARTLR